jgi:hypothetical protein
MAVSTALLAILAPGLALGTMTEIGVAPGDVLTYGGATGSSGASGVSGATGTTGLTGVSGTTSNTSAVPQCPGSPCYALTQTTGFQVKVGATKSITTISQAGSIVAWTVTLGSPTLTAAAGQQSQTAYFDSNEGGPAEAGIAILKAGKHLEYSLVAQSPVEQLLPYFGETVQFPLAASIPVTRGEILALTVPTWAPVLALTNEAGHTYGRYVSWRSSRETADKGCKLTSTQTAQQSLRSTVEYGCLYQDVRLTYSALEISTP